MSISVEQVAAIARGNNTPEEKARAIVQHMAAWGALESAQTWREVLQTVIEETAAQAKRKRGKATRQKCAVCGRMVAIRGGRFASHKNLKVPGVCAGAGLGA